MYIKRNQLFFVFTSKKREMLTSFMLELLTKVTHMINDFCGGLEEELMRKNFIMIYELIDEVIDYGHPQITHPEILRRYVDTQVERDNTGYLDKLWGQLRLDKLKYSDSVTEKESLKSIQNDTNDIFLELQEKVSAVFNAQGFAIYIKISGMLLVKNYIHNRLNLRVQLNEDFNIDEEQKFSSSI